GRKNSNPYFHHKKISLWRPNISPPGRNYHPQKNFFSPQKKKHPGPEGIKNGGNNRKNPYWGKGVGGGEEGP
ncbi:hypothetical protein, partial [Escherichia coli]|uniref:hypothetical protein n=1 Tax=Escherichia coli TaxID=562 RepID=UPI001BC8DFB2